MRNLPNIERSVFHPGEYVGYSATGRVWRISRQQKEWLAKPQTRAGEGWVSWVYASTLAEVSERLTSID